MVTVFLVEGEFLTVLDAIEEVHLAGFRIREFIDDVLNIGNGAFEALVNLSVGSFEIRNLSGAFEAFSLKDDLAAVGIGVGDAPPDTHCVGMLLGRSM